MSSKAWHVAAALSTAAVAISPATAQTGSAALSSVEAQQQPVWNFHHEQILGTSLQLTIRAATREKAQTAEQAALAVIDQEEARLSSWRQESELARWQKTFMTPVPVSAELFSVLNSFDQWREKTGGALDPSVEAATRLWKQAAAQGRTPDEAEIATVQEAIQQAHWSLDAEHQTATRLSETPLAFASFVKVRIIDQAAQAALQAGATGVTLNAGGDVVSRGAITQIVSISDPASAADNADALESVLVKDRTVATSGGARRGFQIREAVAVQAPEYSHLIDPKTASPVSHILSSTVIAKDAETAGALATAFSVMPISESRALAAKLSDVEYMLVLADGSRIHSPSWSSYRTGEAARPWLTHTAMPVSKVASGLWDPRFELAIELNLPRIDNARYRRPYVAVWVEDGDHYPVRTLALWTENPRWLPDLKRWYRDDQIRSMSEGTDISRTVGSATRPAGRYNLIWDGKDNSGKPVKAGHYTICIEVSREHGGYELQQREIDFSGKPSRLQINPGQEAGPVVLDYRKR